MVYRFQLTYAGILDILDLKYIPTTTTGYTLPPGMYEFIDINFMLKSLFPKSVKVDITIDDIRLKSDLTSQKTITEKAFFYINLCFTQSLSGELGDFPGFVQLIPRSYKSDKTINVTGVDKVHLKCDCIDGNMLNGIRETILYSFGLTSPPAHKIYNQPKVKLFKKIN